MLLLFILLSFNLVQILQQPSNTAGNKQLIVIYNELLSPHIILGNSTTELWNGQQITVNFFSSAGVVLVLHNSFLLLVNQPFHLVRNIFQQRLCPISVYFGFQRDEYSKGKQRNMELEICKTNHNEASCTNRSKTQKGLQWIL